MQNGTPQTADMAAAREIWNAIQAARYDDHEQLMALRMRWEQEITGPIHEHLLARDPDQNHVSLFVEAADHASGIRADLMLEDGSTWEDALPLVGSYGRCEWVKRHVLDGTIPQEAVYKDLPDLWRGSDPDDTDPWWTVMWGDAWDANGRQPILDDKPLPGKKLIVYRGQIGEETLGLSWTLQQHTAEAFAKTGGGRMVRLGGVILSGRVKASNVYAYLTRRGEAEIIVPPTAVRNITTVGKMVEKKA